MTFHFDLSTPRLTTGAFIMTDGIQTLKQAIWEESGKNLDKVNEARKGIKLDEATYDYWEAVLRQMHELNNPRKKPKARKQPLSPEHEARYIKAYHDYQARNFPHWVKDGHTLDPRPVDTGTANGLTAFIVNYINWTGYRATRITTEGRSIEKEGKVIRIPTQTRKGTADVSATIKGRAVMLEIKAGKDKPSPAQLQEQQRERKAGGIYEFISSPEDLYRVFDGICEQKELFS